MSTIKIANFTGENPSTSARVDAITGSAQLASNLLATTVEFRPLLDDLTVDSAPANTKTLYKFESASGFIKTATDFNYVKTQLNDDLTERTYVSDNTGATAPQEVDNTSATIRPLGVPYPLTKPTVALQAKTQFTRSDGDKYINDTLAPALVVILKTASSVELLQPTNLYGTTVVDNTVTVAVTKSNTVVFDALKAYAATLGIQVPDTQTVLTASAKALPRYALVNVPNLRAALLAIASPTDSSKTLLDGNQNAAAQLADALAAFFDPNSATFSAQRSALDSAIKEFAAACSDGLDTFPSTAPYSAVLTTDPYGADAEQRNADILRYNDGRKAPEAPAEPTGAVYAVDSNEKTDEWKAYDTKVARYNKDLAAYNAAKSTALSTASAVTSAIKTAIAKCEAAYTEIERLYAQQLDKLPTLIQSQVNTIINTGTASGAVKFDPDPIIDSRFYIYTYINDRGEESAPSPVSDMVSVDQNDSVQVAVMAPPNGFNIVGYRVYRSNVASNGAEFQLVAPLKEGDLPPEALPYVKFIGGYFSHFRLDTPSPLLSPTDSMKSEQLGEVCPSTTWFPPPVRGNDYYHPKGANPYIRGFVNMPNGIVAGFIDNFVAFCEPYKPYAWPVEYQITTDANIVGLGVFGQTLFVGTTANPYLISGSDSASMSGDRLAFPQACASRSSIVSVGDGVIYSSPDGLCFVGNGGAKIITQGLFAREDWQLLDPTSIIGAYHDGVYYFSYSGDGGGTYALDFNAQKLHRVDLKASAFFRERKTDALFYVEGTSVKKFMGGSTRRTGLWKSGLLTLAAHSGYAWVQVDGYQSANDPVTVKWYGDGQLVHTATITDIKPQRLPAGRYLEHELEIAGRARLTKVMMATSTQELQQA